MFDVLLTATFLASSPNLEVDKVADLEQCYPAGEQWEGYFDRSEFVSKAQDNQKEYFLIHLFQPDTNYPDPLIVSRPLDGGQCKQEFLNITGDDVSLSDALNNPEIGKQLTLGLYQKHLNTIGKEALQAHVNQMSFTHDEDIWALEQLGFKVPKDIQLIKVIK